MILLTVHKSLHYSVVVAAIVWEERNDNLEVRVCVSIYTPNLKTVLSEGFRGMLLIQARPDVLIPMN